jgi:hypothetical protein
MAKTHSTTRATASRVDSRDVRISAAIPHPLSKFGISGKFVDGFFADVILDLLHDSIWHEPDSPRARGAMWFLLQSEQAYHYACLRAGIDGLKLRQHLAGFI